MPQNKDHSLDKSVENKVKMAIRARSKNVIFH